jgi:hypothetical protein
LFLNLLSKFLNKEIGSFALSTDCDRMVVNIICT